MLSVLPYSGSVIESKKGMWLSMNNTVEKDVKDLEKNAENYDKKDIERGKGMAILSYILPPIPYFIEKENKWVRYHAVQGMNLFIIAIAVSIAVSIISSIVLSISWRLWSITSALTSLVSLAIFVLCVMGIINVCQEKAKELPLINKIKIIKK